MDTDTPSFTVEPQTPRRQLRQRGSLEHVLSFTLRLPEPSPHEASEATLLYHLILDDCEADNVVLRKPSGDGDRVRDDMYDEDILKELSEGDVPEVGEEEDGVPGGGSAVPLHKLFRAIYDYCPRPEGRANLVRIALHGLFPVEDHDDADQRSLSRILPRARLWRYFTPDEKEQVYRILADFAADFLEGFFFPLKAQGRCTLTTRSDVGPEKGTPRRLSNLRCLCLARDGNRCVVTRMYDSIYLDNYRERTGRMPRQFGVMTEAAHIIPHSLNALSDNVTDLPPSKRMVWQILNMFDQGVTATLSGALIDTPMNAMILASELHDRFGRLQCYLQEAPSGALNTYTFHTTPGAIPLDPAFAPTSTPIVFKNNERGGTPADLPSPRLLALHRACCLMLSMSGAAGYVENLLHDTETLMQKGVLAEDGSSNFALFLRMRGMHDPDGLENDLPAAVMAQ